MASWEQEVARRRAIIEGIYRDELAGQSVDEEGMKYWLDQSQILQNDDKLRDAIRFAGGVSAPATGAADPTTTDPTLAAFLRQMEFDEAGISTSLDRARAQARQSIASQAPLFDQQRTQAQQNVNNNAEARGMFRSGGRITAGAQARDNIDINQRQFETNQNQNVVTAEQRAADSIASLRRQKAEQELASRNRMTQGSIK